MQKRFSLVFSVLMLSFFVCSAVYGQTVTGEVTDTSGEILPGANILVKGTQQGTSTNASGKYEVEVPSLQDTLVFSFIGYETKEVPINGRTIVNVQLTSTALLGEELIVVGYGTQREEDVTTAISSVSASNFEDQPITDVREALQAQAAGVQVSQFDGAPGNSGKKVRIRGISSITADNEPLYVINGYPGGNISTLDPSDIESIQILKDASATAIYGSRGSNGVVLITTKQGTAGESNIEVSSYTAWQSVANKIEMASAGEFAQMFVDARNNAWEAEGGSASDPNSARPVRFQIPSEFQNPSSLQNTDWQDQIFRTAPIRKVQLGASGGSEDLQYYLSGSFYRQEGVIINSAYNRYSFNLRLNAELSDKFNVGVNLAPSYTENNQVETYNTNFQGHNTVQSALSYLPVQSVRNPDGSYSSYNAFGFGLSDLAVHNPVAYTNAKNESSGLGGTGSINVEYNILDNLQFVSRAGTSIDISRNDVFYPSFITFTPSPPPGIPTGNSSRSQLVEWVNENTLTFEESFGGIHDLKLLAGYTAQKANAYGNNLSATNFPNDRIQTLNAGQISGGGSSASEHTLLSYLGRVNYGYDDRYLLTATIRRDGSSRFGSDNKWGVFPSLSVGWIVSNEVFMEDFEVVSDLKIRGSYGATGNNSIPNYGSFGLIGSDNYVLGNGSGSIVPGLSPITSGNPDLGWEQSEEINLGLDLGLVNDRIEFTFDYYERTTSDLLLNVQVPQLTGFSNVLTNIGKVENKGVEFALHTQNIQQELQWNTDFNLSVNRNEVLELGPNGDPILGSVPFVFGANTHITQIGSPLGSYYGFVADGIYEDQQEINNTPIVEGTQPSQPGDIKFRDINGDGVITEDDRTTIGIPYPDFTWNFRNAFYYKNFDLSVLLEAQMGGEVLNLTKRKIGLPDGDVNVTKEVANNYWQSPENPGNGVVPRATSSRTGLSSEISSYFVEDASYVRIRNITFGYSLPSAILERLSMGKLRVYVSAQNLFTFTDYDGYNPQVSTNGANPLSPGADYFSYPIARTFSLGINLGF